MQNHAANTHTHTCVYARYDYNRKHNFFPLPLFPKRETNKRTHFPLWLLQTYRLAARKQPVYLFGTALYLDSKFVL